MPELRAQVAIEPEVLVTENPVSSHSSRQFSRAAAKEPLLQNAVTPAKRSGGRDFRHLFLLP